MNINSKEALQKCARESHEGLLTFPQVLGLLAQLGVESYFVDYREQSTTYYLSDNEAVRVLMSMPLVEIPSLFNNEAVVLAIRAAQADMVRYPEFLKLTMSAGCIGYIVWISGRRVSYFGRQGEDHTEHFPQE